MPRSTPQIITLVAVLVGAALFAVTLALVDREETLDGMAALGQALPLVLAPSIAWHVLRTLGWYICFPRDVRPGFWRVFRVRLTADAVAYFTIRGVASEPLRVLLLLDRVPARVSAAASVLERAAIGLSSVLFVGICAAVAMQSTRMPVAWQEVFGVIAILAGLTFVLAVWLVMRPGRYLGPLFARLHKRTGWHWTEGRVVAFVSDVETIVLELARADGRRLRWLALLALICFVLMALEVRVVFWAIGEPISLWSGVIVETFTRSASLLGGAIPANLGALEASNAMVTSALGLGAGAGSLALARRVRSLLWAGLGLALYPRATRRARQEIAS